MSKFPCAPLRHLMLLLAVLCWAPLAAASSEESKPASAGALEYMDLRPSFTTNYGGPGAIHYLKVDITLRLSKDPKASERITHNMPYIRHELVMLLMRQTDADVNSLQGKEKLRADALAAVQKVLQDETGTQPVEDLLFTNFVVQQ